MYSKLQACKRHSSHGAKERTKPHENRKGKNQHGSKISSSVSLLPFQSKAMKTEKETTKTTICKPHYKERTEKPLATLPITKTKNNRKIHRQTMKPHMILCFYQITPKPPKSLFSGLTRQMGIQLTNKWVLQMATRNWFLPFTFDCRLLPFGSVTLTPLPHHPLSSSPKYFHIN